MWFGSDLGVSCGDQVSIYTMQIPGLIQGVGVMWCDVGMIWEWFGTVLGVSCRDQVTFWIFGTCYPLLHLIPFLIPLRPAYHYASSYPLFHLCAKHRAGWARVELVWPYLCKSQGKFKECSWSDFCANAMFSVQSPHISVPSPDSEVQITEKLALPPPV